VSKTVEKCPAPRGPGQRGLRLEATGAAVLVADVPQVGRSSAAVLARVLVALRQQ